MSGWVLLGLFGVIQSIYVYMLSAIMSKPVETERVKKLIFIVNLFTMVLSLQHYAFFALYLIGLFNTRTEAMLCLVGQRAVILDPIFIPSSYLDSRLRTSILPHKYRHIYHGPTLCLEWPRLFPCFRCSSLCTLPLG